MKILLANYTIGGNTGSETWVYTMRNELKKGNEVRIYTLDDILDYKPDIAIINHNTCLFSLKYLPCKKIFTSHGIIPDLEQPIKGADVYVSVSEEVQQNLLAKGFESIIIRNPIDCEKYKSIKPTNEKLTNVLFSSHYQGKALKVIKQACQELGLNLTIIGKGNQVDNPVDYINDNDLVIGLGRTAYEAMACERNVIVYDYNGGEGLITPETILEYRKNNCSGRRYKKDFTINDLKEELLKYNKDLGKDLREYILENNNIKKVAKQYLEL